MAVPTELSVLVKFKFVGYKFKLFIVILIVVVVVIPGFVEQLLGIFG